MRGWVAAALWLGLAGCAEAPTQIILVVTTDLAAPGQVDEVKVEAQGPAMVSQNRTVDLTGPGDLPVTLGLRPASLELLDPVRVTVFLFGPGAAPMLQQRNWTGWRRGESRVLRMHVTGDCAGVVCDNNRRETCIEGACASGERDSAALEVWDGDDPPLGQPYDGGS